MSNIAYRIGGGNFCRFSLAPVTIFEVSGGQRAFADDEAVRNAQKLRVGELHAGAGVAIVEQYIDAGGVEVPVQGVPGLLYSGRFLRVDRHKDKLEGSNGLGPQDAVGIVILSYRRSDHGRHADAVSSHEHRLRI